MSYVLKGGIMKKLAFVFVLALSLSGCATMTRYMGGYEVKPFIGMDEAYFRKHAPFVYTVNETVTKYGVSRQYVFQQYTHPRYVYFENGKLTAMQN